MKVKPNFPWETNKQGMMNKRAFMLYNITGTYRNECEIKQ